MKLFSLQCVLFLIYFSMLTSAKNTKNVLACTMYSFFTQIESLCTCMEMVKPFEKVYFVYLDVRVGDQDKSWAPHRVCSTCVDGLCMWAKGKLESFCFEVPMTWMETRNHSDDCYLCSCSIQGYSF